MITLALDAATYEGTVAVLDDERVLAEGAAAMRGRDAERLMPAVESTLRGAGVSLSHVDRIVCGAGPGSFTSLRIAGSLAKGLAVGAAKPLFVVSSLALIVAGNATAPGRYLAVLDAMRGEYFASPVEFDGIVATPNDAHQLVNRFHAEALAARFGATAVGPDFGDRWAPRARGAARLVPSIEAAAPVNLADWEPRYGRLAEAQVKLEAAAK